MRLLPTCALLLSLSAVPGFCQKRLAAKEPPPIRPPPCPRTPAMRHVDYAALRERLAEQYKVLTEQVTTQRAIVKKNQELLKEAQKLDASNKKLSEEMKKIETENADLEKQRMALKSSQKPAADLASVSGSN